MSREQLYQACLAVQSAFRTTSSEERLGEAVTEIIGQINDAVAEEERKRRLPKRAYQVEAVIGADTPQDLMRVWGELRYELNEGLIGESCCGGPSYGWTIKVTEDPTMTHERYFQEMEKAEQRGDL